MPAKRKPSVVIALVHEWALPSAATLGSSVRARGILLEMRARLPSALKKSLDLVGGQLVLGMAEGADRDFRAVRDIVSKGLKGIEDLPVIPREIEDILTISTTERHRWLKDGRLPSAGTRTVKLRGRAKKITFHVFDPRQVERLLDQDAVSGWREDDVIAKAERRRQASWKARLTRAQKTGAPAVVAEGGPEDDARFKLKGWAEFERDVLLR